MTSVFLLLTFGVLSTAVAVQAQPDADTNAAMISQWKADPSYRKLTPTEAAQAVSGRLEKRVSTTVVGNADRDPGRPRGEDRPCGDVVKCRTVEVMLRPGERLMSIRTEAAEASADINSDAGWHANPQPAIGWTWWEASGQNIAPDGRTRVWATLKNWSHNRSRRARMIAMVLVPS